MGRFSGAMLFVVVLLSAAGTRSAAKTPGEARASGAPEPPAADMTLDQAVAYAMEHSGIIQAARAGTEALEAKLQQANWAAWPHASLKSILAPLPRHRGNAIQGSTDLSEWGVFTYTEISGHVPLYTFGKISNLKEAARLGVDVGRALERVAADEVRLRLTQAFWGIALAGELGRVIEEGRKYMDKARRHLDALEKEDDPSFDPVDRLKLSVYDAQVLDKELGAERALRAALAGTRVLMGMDPFDAVGFAVGELEPVDAPRDPDTARLAELAVRRRPELAALRRGVEARKAEVAGRRSAFYPDFFLAGQFKYGYSNVADPQSSPFANDPYNSYSAGGGVGLKFDLEIGRKLGELREAEAELARLEAKAAEAERGVRLEVAGICDELRDTGRLLEARKKAMEAARGWVIAKSDLYDNDLEDLDKVLTALVAFFQAKMDYLQTIYRFNVTAARLKRAVGGSVADE